MNERIKQLAMQADPEYTGDEDDNMGHALVGNAAIQRFAELIVKECLFIIDDERKPEIINRIEMWEQIKSHFGVE